jgi:hypothetical protein
MESGNRGPTGTSVRRHQALTVAIHDDDFKAVNTHVEQSKAPENPSKFSMYALTIAAVPSEFVSQKSLPSIPALDVGSILEEC